LTRNGKRETRNDAPLPWSLVFGPWSWFLMSFQRLAEHRRDLVELAVDGLLVAPLQVASQQRLGVGRADVGPPALGFEAIQGDAVELVDPGVAEPFLQPRQRPILVGDAEVD